PSRSPPSPYTTLFRSSVTSVRARLPVQRGPHVPWLHAGSLAPTALHRWRGPLPSTRRRARVPPGGSAARGDPRARVPHADSAERSEEHTSEVQSRENL